MSPRRSLWLPVAALACGLCGCALTDSWGAFWHETKRLASPNPDDIRDTTNESQEEWEFVGKEGREGQSIEHDPDQWYRKYFMSEKARSIEENLGFQ